VGFLADRRILITGVLSNRSIAYGIARACQREGAVLAFTYVNDDLKDRVTRLAADFGHCPVWRCDVARDDTAILMITESGYGKRTQLDRFNRQGRGGQGVIGIKLTGRKGKVVAAFMVGLDDDIVAVSSGGVMIRMNVRDISSQGRDATGVRVMSLDDGQTVASVALILASENE
jgi:DNA gyrase/topoisomerase IV subunit A